MLLQECFLENGKTWWFFATTGFYRIFSYSDLHACASLTSVCIILAGIKWLRPIVNQTGSHLLLLILLTEEASYILLLLIIWLDLILHFPLNWSDMVVIRVLTGHLLSLLDWVHLQLVWRMRDIGTCSVYACEVIFKSIRLATIFGRFIASTQKSSRIASKLLRRCRLWVRLWCNSLLGSLPVWLPFLFFCVWSTITRLRAFVDHLNFLNSSTLHSVIWICRVWENALHRWSSWCRSWER